MRQNNRFQINQLFQNSKFLTIIISICITGLSAGVFFEICLVPEDKILLSSPIISLLKAEEMTFIPAFISNFILLFIIYLLSYTKYGKILASALLFIKTFALGFCSALLVNTFNNSGILIILLSLLPSNIILLTAFVIATSFSYIYPSPNNERSGKRKNHQNKPAFILPLLIGLILLAALIEAVTLKFLNV